MSFIILKILIIVLICFYLYKKVTIFISRKKYPKIRIFVSFSISRSRYWSHFVRYILRPVFYRYNISFYDFIVFAKKIHPLDINTNCRIIDSELEKADIYIRCYDKNVEHKFRHIDQIHSSIIWNPFIGSFSQRNYDYLFYETEIASYEYFTNKYNRIELILLEESPAYSCPNPKMVTALYHSISESPFKFAEKVAEEVHFLYNILYPRIHFNIDNSQSGDDNG